MSRAERRAGRKLDPTVAGLMDTSMAVAERAVEIDLDNQRLRRMVLRLRDGHLNWTRWPAEERRLMEEIIGEAAEEVTD